MGNFEPGFKDKSRTRKLTSSMAPSRKVKGLIPRGVTNESIQAWLGLFIGIFKLESWKVCYL